tara:strand:+ start:174 stop:728 length:555 start_codon:yes stop_codon:yes gene_type:complete
MAIFTNNVFPSGGETGHGGGIIQVKNFSRSGPLYYYKINEGVYLSVLISDITPSSSNNKILILASLDGTAHRGGSGNSAAGEFEGWLGYNATYNGSVVTSNEAGVTAFTNLAPITGLGAWSNSSQVVGSKNAHILHSPGTTSICRYCLIVNRRSAVYVNNEWNTNPDAGGSDQGTTITLMEISS